MVKVVLLTDLDNTIIHGRRKHKCGDICIEKDSSGKEIAYMGREVLKRFMKVQDMYKSVLEIIPVTSRSEAEYLRIADTGMLNFRYAFIDNGAGLMKDGIRYTKGVWGNYGLAVYLKPYLHLLEDLVDRLRLVDDCYYFGKIKDGVSVAAHTVLGETSDGHTVYLQRSADKLYILTNRTSKENASKAVRKFSKEYGAEGLHIICAGDSIMDTPMAKWSDTAIFSDAVKPFCTGSVPCSIRFVKDSGNNLVNSILDSVCRICENVV